jgi:GTP-binding protein HflX
LSEKVQPNLRALTVQLDIAGEPEKSSFEFTQLVTSAGLNIAATVTGKREKPHPRHFVGVGKLDEIYQLVLDMCADVVLFDHALTPGQERHLRDKLKVPVLDRSGLILDIFSQRARSFEGRLQVELAQLKHLSVRLIRGWTHLERQKGGIGLRGPGETQLETDRRLIAQRIKQIRHKLDRVRSQREQGRRARHRSGLPTVSVVGYTNAGKSTLFNALTKTNVYAADQLFATLDPTFRRLSLPNGAPCVLTDTVGFIQDLPHELIEAFQATLLETREADVLLHVVDVSDDDKEHRMLEVNRILGQIGADEIPQVVVYNKIDVLGSQPRVDVLKDNQAFYVWLSASQSLGLDLLLDVLQQILSHDRVLGLLRLKPEEFHIRAQLYQWNAVQDETLKEDGSVELYLDISPSAWGKLVKKHPYLEKRIWEDRSESIELAAL